MDAASARRSKFRWPLRSQTALERRVHLQPRDRLGRQGRSRVERHADAEVLREGRFGRLREVASGDLACLRAAEAVEDRDHARVDVAGDDADEHEALHALRPPGGVEQRDEAAVAGPEHHRSLELEGVAEVGHVLDPGLERPVLLGAPVAATGAALVEVDDLRIPRELRADVLLVAASGRARVPCAGAGRWAARGPRSRRARPSLRRRRSRAPCRRRGSSCATAAVEARRGSARAPRTPPERRGRSSGAHPG